MATPEIHVLASEAKQNQKQPEIDERSPSMNTDPLLIRDSSSVEDDDRILFVGDLASDVNEGHLHEKFSPFGEIEEAVVKRDRMTQKSLGYGFVTMRNRDAADKAKQTLNHTEIQERKIRIGWAQKNTNLFVGDLVGVSQEELIDTFKKYGTLYEDECYIKGSNYGFVRFKRRCDAERAKAEMDGKLLGKGIIRIGWGDSSSQRSCVHIQFNPIDGHDKITEAVLMDAFSPFGEVESISIPAAFGQLKGFAFVKFSEDDIGEASAARAIQRYTEADESENIIGGIPVRVHYGKKPRKKHGRTHTRGSSSSSLGSPTHGHLRSSSFGRFGMGIRPFNQNGSPNIHPMSTSISSPGPQPIPGSGSVHIPSPGAGTGALGVAPVPVPGSQTGSPNPGELMCPVHLMLPQADGQWRSVTYMVPASQMNYFTKEGNLVWLQDQSGYSYPAYTGSPPVPSGVMPPVTSIEGASGEGEGEEGGDSDKGKEGVQQQHSPASPNVSAIDLNS